jgi:uncharacterized repeat protein (TIGR03803 family)
MSRHAAVAWALILVPAASAAQSIQLLHAFPDAPAAASGGVIQVPDGTFYGATRTGLYRVDALGAVTVVAPLSSGGGRLVQGADGALYGTTNDDENAGRGSVFRFDPATGELRTLHTFRTHEGRSPIGGLVEAGGQLYGVTSDGPDGGNGTIFRTDRVTGDTRTLYAFSDRVAPIAWEPAGPLTLAPDGRLYGMTVFATGGGGLYRIDPAAPEAGITVVAIVPNGIPVGRLVLGPAGRLYGSAQSSGPEQAGTIFSLDPLTGAFTTLYALTPSNGLDGIGPGQLTAGLDGHLYGTTILGNVASSPAPGFVGPPTLFRLRLLAGGAVAFETLRGLDPAVDGRPEPADLTTAADGRIYGTAAGNGPFGNGTLFRFDPLAPGPPSNPIAFTVLHAFPSPPSMPSAPVLAPDGFLYGTTAVGGATGRGAVYRLDRSTGQVTILGDFPGGPVEAATHGASALVPGPDGMLYGTTTSYVDPSPSPTARQNRIVRIDPATGTATVASERLEPLSSGTTYRGGLVRTPAGGLYGLRVAVSTTTLFRFDPQTNATTDVALVTGGSPASTIMLAADDGRIYLTMAEVLFFGTGNSQVSTTLRRVDPANGSVAIVGSGSDTFLATNPVQGGGGRIYYGVTNAANTSTRILGVDPVTNAQEVVCTIDGSGYVTTLASAADGALHGTLNRPSGPALVRCDPTTHAVDAAVLPAALDAAGGPLVAVDGLLYGISSRALFRMSAPAPLPPLDSESDGLPNAWETAWGLDPFDGTGDDGAAGDPDRDGRTNAQELADGTHPRGFVRRSFAEGATGPFFRTRIDLGNPRVRPVIVQLRFLTDTGLTVTRDLVLGATAHLTIDPGALPGLAHANFSTIVESDGIIGVDRTMTWDASAYGSSLETGVAAPATTWHFAEGATSDPFALFYLLQNPQSTAVSATVRYLRPFGQPPIERTYVLPAHSRTTIAVDDQSPELASTDVSAVVTATAPIVAEGAL